MLTPTPSRNWCPMSGHIGAMMTCRFRLGPNDPPLTTPCSLATRAHHRIDGNTTRRRAAVGSTDEDARLVERPLEELGGTAVRADHDGLVVGDRADGAAFREGHAVDDQPDVRAGLDALDGVPLAIADHRALADDLVVGEGAVEPARGLSVGLVLHLELTAGCGEDALADEIP